MVAMEFSIGQRLRVQVAIDTLGLSGGVVHPMAASQSDDDPSFWVGSQYKTGQSDHSLPPSRFLFPSLLSSARYFSFISSFLLCAHFRPAVLFGARLRPLVISFVRSFQVLHSFI
jgi:hypothetical protein